MQIFAARDTVQGMESTAARRSFEQAAKETSLDAAGFTAAANSHALDIMAQGLARPDNKRAATAYQIDEAAALRLGFGEAANITDRQSIIYDPEFGSRIVINAPAEAQEAAKGATLDTAGVKVAESFANASTEEQQAAEGLSTGEALGNVAEGAAQLAEGVASFAEKALDTVASVLEGLIGGGSTPAPKQEPELCREPKRKLTMKEFLAEVQSERSGRTCRH